MSILVHAQQQSAFFRAPTEIRHAIYHLIRPERLHVFADRGRLRISECIACDPLACCNAEDQNPLCGRWFSSSCGPHYNCEARVGGRHTRLKDPKWTNTGFLSLMSTCKRG
ncbi:hypothetical protein EJ04DRAFT_516457 [Polyplosphaeria fusca]|uniref:DUF7730 domain-containing protein n=1 Tax=Polyplosphaeria fusca TaxID=682080 RepID=A0A9P4QJU8_9PLEO|nr:hypothetical protein EJ04DRAFT_516457 [Polyplosphaeria fusca]